MICADWQISAACCSGVTGSAASSPAKAGKTESTKTRHNAKILTIKKHLPQGDAIAHRPKINHIQKEHGLDNTPDHGCKNRRY